MSQSPGQGPHVIHQGQIAFQSAAPSPVSYQLQYVQNQSPAMTGSSISLHQQQPQMVFQPPGQVQFQNGAVHQVVGVKHDESSGQVQQHMVQPGHVMQVKQLTQTVQVMQPYSPSVCFAFYHSSLTETQTGIFFLVGAVCFFTGVETGTEWAYAKGTAAGKKKVYGGG